MTDRIEQIRRAHKSARPKPANPAWCHTHRDCGILLEEIDRLRAFANEILKQINEPDEICTDGVVDAFDKHLPEMTDPDWASGRLLTVGKDQS